MMMAIHHDDHDDDKDDNNDDNNKDDDDDWTVFLWGRMSEEGDEGVLSTPWVSLPIIFRRYVFQARLAPSWRRVDVVWMENKSD